MVLTEDACIGLLSISVTLFGVLGGLLTIEKINFLQTLRFSLIFILYILYILIICAFVAAVIHAFWAYHKGSPLLDDNNQKNIEILASQGKMYIKLDHKLVHDLLIPGSKKTKDDLIEKLDLIIVTNSKINVKKSNELIKSFNYTMYAIGLLLAMTIYISAITLEILR